MPTQKNRKSKEELDQIKKNAARALQHGRADIKTLSAADYAHGKIEFDERERKQWKRAMESKYGGVIDWNPYRPNKLR